MSTTRRAFPTPTTAAQAAAGAARIRIGACVVGLDQARQAGLEGVEVGVGEAAERLSIADPKVRAHYKEQMQQTGLPICSLMMGLFNSQPLASDPRAIAAAPGAGYRWGAGSGGDGGEVGPGGARRMGQEWE